MARTVIPVLALSRNAGADVTPATKYVAADPVNHHSLAADADNLVLHVNETAGAAETVTVKAGDRAAGAWMAGQGDLDVAVGANESAAIIVERARFMQAGGLIHVDLSAGFTGTLAAMKLPQGGVA